MNRKTYPSPTWYLPLLLGLLMPPAASAQDPLRGRIVDLTHSFGVDTIYWPTDQKGFQLERGNNGPTPHGYYYAANRFAAAEHGGTHLDAPIHVAEGKPTAEQVPLERLIGPAAVIDVTAACAKDVDYQITVGDLNAWEVRHKRQLVDVIVLLRTGWSKNWPDRKKYLGTERRGQEALSELHFPGLSLDAARWLVEHRSIKAIGIDTASIDYGRASSLQSHAVLCGQSVPIFENVANLDAVPEVGATIVALPMKIADGSGAPLRIIAFLPE